MLLRQQQPADLSTALDCLAARPFCGSVWVLSLLGGSLSQHCFVLRLRDSVGRLARLAQHPRVASNTAMEPPFVALTFREYRLRLQHFIVDLYSERCPERLPQVQPLILKHQDMPQLLYVHLCTKYGLAPTAPLDHYPVGPIGSWAADLQHSHRSAADHPCQESDSMVGSALVGRQPTGASP